MSIYDGVNLVVSGLKFLAHPEPRPAYVHVCLFYRIAFAFASAKSRWRSATSSFAQRPFLMLGAQLAVITIGAYFAEAPCSDPQYGADCCAFQRS